MSFLQEMAKEPDVISLWDRLMGVFIAATGAGTYIYRQKMGLRTTKIGLIAAVVFVLMGVVVMMGKADLLIDPIIEWAKKMMPAG